MPSLSPYYANGVDEDVFGGSSSKFLAPPAKSSTRKVSSRHQQLNGKKSSSSLRASSSLAAQGIVDEGNAAANGRQSLAHELAVALMPEPSAGSRMLAEEFGIDYDEGAEGIDDHIEQSTMDATSLAEELDPHALDASGQSSPSFALEHTTDDLAAHFGSSRSPAPPATPPSKPEQDAIAVLSRDLETTDKFLTHLRHLDTEQGNSSSEQPPLERIASDMIRRINETARDRESQVRELLECEREFRKIAGEVGGNDVLGQLDELTEVEGLTEKSTTSATVEPASASKSDVRPLDTVQEEMEPAQPSWNDWETDPDQHHLGDGEEDEQDDPAFSGHFGEEPPSPSPAQSAFPQAPPPPHGPPTAAKTLPHLAHMRTVTTSLVSSLTAISEHAQVNGAATAEAGRKIRALKNKLGGWRVEWDSAERSRVRIARWEAGFADDGSGSETNGAGTPQWNGTRGASVRIDGRRLVQEHLQAFEIALAEAGSKTKAIMAAS